MNLRNKITAILFSTVVFGMTASAAIVEITDSAEAIVTVTVNNRESGEYVNIFAADQSVTTMGEYNNPVTVVTNTSVSDIENDPQKFNHQGSFITNQEGNGTYSFAINIPQNFISGEYKIWISGEEPKEYDLYYCSFDTTLSIAKGICEGTVENAASSLSDYKRELAIDTELFGVANITDVAKNFIASLADNPIDFITNDGKDGVIEFKKRIQKFALLSAFSNVANKALIFDKNNNYLYQDIISLTDLAVSGNTILDIKGTYLNSDVEIINDLFGRTYANESDLYAQYAKGVIVKCITESNVNGSGHLDYVITKENAEVAKISIPTYISLNDRIEANKNIVGRASEITTDTLQTIIEESCVKTPPKGNGGNTRPSNVPTSPSFSVGGNKVSEQSPVVKEAFSDISEHWAKEAIKFCSEKKIVSGYPDGSFGPDKKVSRAEMAQMTVRMYDISTDENDSAFTDVTSDDWFAPAVIALNNRGIISGVGEKLFEPEMNISREMVAVIIYRINNSPDIETDIKLDFVDSDKISTWAKTAIIYAINEGFIKGYEDNTINPTGEITRGELASVLKRVYDVSGMK